LKYFLGRCTVVKFSRNGPGRRSATQWSCSICN